MPQKQTFTNVTPIASPGQQQTFSNVTPIDGQPPRGALSNLWGDIKSIPGNIYHAATDPDPLADPSVPDDVKNKLVQESEDRAAAKIADRKAQGYGTIYSELSAPAGEMLGANVSGMEDSARRGDPGGVLGHAAAVPLVTAASMAAGDLPAGKIARTMGVVAKPLGVAAEDLPVVGSVIKGVKAAKSVPGDISDIWSKKPVYPGAPEPATPPREMLQAGALARAVQSPPDPAAGLAKIPAAAEPAAVNSGAPLPETPDPALLKARALFEGSTSPPDPAAGLGTIRQPGQAGSIAASMQKPVAAEVAPGFQRGSLQTLLDRSLGAKQLDPKVPLRNQMDIASPAARPAAPSATVPEGHIPVQSTALKSYKYDAGAGEFHAKYGSADNTVHVFGDVTPDEAQAFDGAPSKGQAMQQIKNSHPLVAKIINGKRVAVKASATQ